MEFRKFTAGMYAYGTDDKPTEPQLDNVNFCDPKLQEHLDDPQHENHDALVKVLLFLACCHTIIIDPSTKKLNASSPDELALVNAAI